MIDDYPPIPPPAPKSFRLAAEPEGSGSVDLQLVPVKAHYNLHWSHLHTHHPPPSH